MASNKIPRNSDALVSLATDAADGATTHGGSIGLSQNTAAKIIADLVAYIGDPAATPAILGALNTYNAAKSGKVSANAARRTSESNGRAFCASATGLLKNYLGTQWNSQWQAAGFTSGSLAIPDDPLPMIGEIRGYFLANAAHENAQLGITAADCTSRMTDIGATRATANQSNLTLGSTKSSRDDAFTALYQRMTGVRAELEQLLPDDDPRWYAMGFDRPADGWQPGPVEGLVLTAGGPGIVLSDWDDARRAERYRVFIRVLATDPAPVEVTSTATDSQFTFTGLVSGTEVEVTVIPVNQAGDGAPATATIIVP